MPPRAWANWLDYLRWSSVQLTTGLPAPNSADHSPTGSREPVILRFRTHHTASPSSTRTESIPSSSIISIKPGNYQSASTHYASSRLLSIDEHSRALLGVVGPRF